MKKAKFNELSEEFKVIALDHIVNVLDFWGPQTKSQIVQRFKEVAFEKKEFDIPDIVSNALDICVRLKLICADKKKYRNHDRLELRAIFSILEPHTYFVY